MSQYEGGDSEEGHYDQYGEEQYEENDVDPDDPYQIN